LQEEDVLDLFGEIGPVKNLHFNLDKRTGYAKGYAFVEYEEVDKAKEAIKQLNGREFGGQTLRVDWAFKSEPRESSKSKHKSRRRD
jgi:RNA-binding protein 8A